jgi:hypothetical protein
MYSSYSGCTIVYQLRFSTLAGKCNQIFGTVNASGISPYITGGNFAQMQILSTVGYVISMGTIVTSYSIIRFSYQRMV